MKTKIIFSIFFINVLLFSSYALESKSPSSAASVDMEKMRKQQEQMQAQMQEQQKRQMEMLKKQNPKLYEQMAAQQASQEQIAKITNDFRAGKISESTARTQLRPLIKEAMKSKLANLDTEIGQLKKRIQSLEAAKSNPDKLVDQSIDVYLGKASPNPGDTF